VASTQELYFISWACLFLLLVIPRLKLPAIYPLAEALVFAALRACRFGRVYQLAERLHAAGAVALSFAFLAFYA
jgi:uncharacterized protein